MAALAVLNNIEVAIETDVVIKDALVPPTFGPVRWVESVQSRPCSVYAGNVAGKVCWLAWSSALMPN